jgi:hypothetical protein
MPRIYGMGNPSEQTVSRRVASELTGLKPATLKKMAMQHRGPAFIKLGTSQQARTFYRLDEIEKWKRDPVAYERRHQGPKHDRRHHPGR